MSLSRRKFIQTTLLGVSITALPVNGVSSTAKLQRRPRILLRGSWHSINIGDIAHTFGTIHLIKTYLPEVEIILWQKNVKDGVKEMIRRRFPNLQIIQKEHEVKSAFK